MIWRNVLQTDLKVLILREDNYLSWIKLSNGTKNLIIRHYGTVGLNHLELQVVFIFRILHILPLLLQHCDINLKCPFQESRERNVYSTVILRSFLFPILSILPLFFNRWDVGLEWRLCKKGAKHNRGLKVSLLWKASIFTLVVSVGRWHRVELTYSGGLINVKSCAFN